MTQCFEFQEPTNMNAIRSNIMQRIKKRNDTLSPIHSKQQPAALLDSGLPSPPVESCTYEEEEEQTSYTTMPSPASTVSDSPTTQLESANAIREKIQLLKQEKHKLFQTMKNLLSEPEDKPVIRSRRQSQTMVKKEKKAKRK